MNMDTSNEQATHGRMRRTGALALVLLMLILPITTAGAFALTEGGELQLDVVVIRARLGQYGVAASGESGLFSLTSGIDPSGPVHGGGYRTSAGSGLFAQTGSDPSCLAWSELDMLC
ncbi:MAG: hypothetical protein GWN58_06235 [Anaerolineae bacterium]|nr:hypothetical protein [Anaerolineae bacterium]